MPGKYKRRFKRTYGRRRSYRRIGFRRRFKRNTRRITTSRMKSRFISDRTMIKYVCNQTFRLTTDTTVGWAGEAFIANSLSDPFGTASSTAQPTGLDQWGAFYSKYIVKASKLTCEVQNLTAATAPRFVIVPSPNNHYAVITNWDINDYKPEEYPYAQHRMINSSGGGRPLYMKSYMTTGKIFGKKGIAIDNLYEGAMPTGGSGATSPNQQWYWNIAVLNRDLPATAVTVVVLCKLTFYCQMLDRQYRVSASEQ